MRLILSRKGFDSGAGRKPSPILPDGSMVSLPIPERDSGTTYGELSWRGEPLAPLIEQLTKGRVPARYGVHMDPDLRQETLPRKRGWRPSLGQVGAAQTVLARAGVGLGDVFLFFGWFREAESGPHGLRYVRGAPNLHVLFGWLQVGEVLALGQDRPPGWADRHPHVVQPQRTHNTLYVASDELRIDGRGTGLAGAGTFDHYSPALRLTQEGERLRSRWSLPGWMLPVSGEPCLGYHDDPGRWRRVGDRVLLDAVARGQEFVLDATGTPEAGRWVRELVRGAEG